MFNTLTFINVDNPSIDFKNKYMIAVYASINLKCQQSKHK